MSSLNTENSHQQSRIEKTPIAIVGMGCWLPGASDARKLWENVLSRRQEFRRMPDVRTPLSDYYDPEGKDPDRFYQSKVAVIDGFNFDRASYRIPESTYVRTDMCQWLALEIANRALEDAGITKESAPRDRTGVFVGNTCTGEGMRSYVMRLRWPVVQRALSSAATLHGVSGTDMTSFMKTTEDCYKSIFPDINEDFVAGGISATIAGRICNHFDFHGGAFVIDGACASSLTTVVTAANMLASNDLDLALAGGVDISLDPFELVGFSRNGALSKDVIRPYDRRGAGFIAGEGGGLVVLKRLEDAQRDGDAVYATLRGWGLSSDGRAGIMQPVAKQQAAAIERAIAGSGCRLEDYDFIEGHGTGTRAGDRTEVEGMSLAMALESGGQGEEDDQTQLARTCGIGSLKSIIGHAKAAAGVASLIKAVAAVNRRVVPPTAGVEAPNEAFNGVGARLYPIRLGEARRPDTVVRAGVSAFGFGGINTHLVIESNSAPSPKLAPNVDERALLVSQQASELFVFAGDSKEELLASVRSVESEAPLLSQGDLVDLAAALAKDLPAKKMRWRAAVVATSADDLTDKLSKLCNALSKDAPISDKPWAKTHKDIYLANGTAKGRIGFLFPGQGSQQLMMVRTLVERYEWARQLADEAQCSLGDTSFLDHIYRPVDRARDSAQLSKWTKALSQTQIAQPAICLASVLCARYLQLIGIEPAVVGGHSLGELTALHVAGAFDTQTLFSTAVLRGKAMQKPPEQAGAMVSLACSSSEAQSILTETSKLAVIANINAPQQTVVSGEADAIDAVIAVANERDITSQRLPVSNAFHSPLMADCAKTFSSALSLPSSTPTLRTPVHSGIESTLIDGNTDLRLHLARQIVSPVNFIDLAIGMKDACDTFIEVGPGRVLSGLCRDIFDAEDMCTPLASDAMAWNPNPAVAVAFANNANINWDAFFAQRLVRPFVRPSQREYLSNPAERPVDLSKVDGPQHNKSLPIALNGGSNGASLEGTLGTELGVDAQHLSAYLQRRGKFLASIAKLDMNSFLDGSVQPNDNVPVPTLVERPDPVPVQPVATQTDEIESTNTGGQLDINGLLVSLISERTGYPESSITTNSRLLDDLNLDSIKAGELVGEAAKRLGAAGAIDASKHANASLDEIASVLAGVAPEQAAVPASGLDTVTSEAAPQNRHQGLPKDPPQENAINGAGDVSSDGIASMLVSLISERTGYPESSMTIDSRLLDDLNLDSIKAGELVAEVSRRVGAAGAIDATKFSNSSITEISEAIVEVVPKTQPSKTIPSVSPATQHGETSLPQPPKTPSQPIQSSNGDLLFTSRYATWTRNYVVSAEPAPRKNDTGLSEEKTRTDLNNASCLIIHDARDSEPSDALEKEIVARGGVVQRITFDAENLAALQCENSFTHQVAILPRTPGEGTLAERVTEMCTRMTAFSKVPVGTSRQGVKTTVTYVQFGGGFFGSEGTSFAPEMSGTLSFSRTLHLEREDLHVRVLDFATSTQPPTMAKFVLDEIGGEEPFLAVGFDNELTRRVPAARISEPARYEPRKTTWSEKDVILVTGGAKGIMAECSLGLARDTGATLALVGRGKALSESGDGGDAEITKTLNRFRTEGLKHVYVSCDITDRDALADAVRKIEHDVGPITGIVHGASILRPTRIDNLTTDGLFKEISPKVLGAWNLCEVFKGKQLKLFVSFSSLVVDHGMPWSAGYGFANEAMERVVQKFAASDQPIPLQIVSYGLWGAVGRPADLKTNDHLLSVGLHDGEIPPEEGVRRLLEVFKSDPGTQRLCIYGRSVGYGPWDALRPEQSLPSNLRFIERIDHLEPDVELIARCHLTLERDQYLHDHVYNGMHIVPTVLALEIIAQAATAVAGSAPSLCRLDCVEMPSPLIVDPTTGLEIELRAEVQEASSPDRERRVNVTISSDKTAFKTSVLSGTAAFAPRRTEMRNPLTINKPLPISARDDLYDRQFFVGPTYQRMGPIYSVHEAQSICTGEVRSARDAARDAFNDASGTMDDTLVIGDPFFRDTLLHTSLLHHLDHMAFTSRIDKIELFEGCEADKTENRVCISSLQWSKDKDAEYELVAMSPDGRIYERWTGFCSKALAQQSDWPKLEDLLDLDRAKVRDEQDLREQVASAASQLDVTAPSVALDCFNCFSDFPIEDRHVHERALAKRAVISVAPDMEGDVRLNWRANGRPSLETREQLDISFSHEGWYCLCSAGSDAQGCDLAAISQGDREDWHALLGSEREPLLKSLSSHESLDIAGTRIWAALEAARKAAETDDVALTVIKRDETSVLFRAGAQDEDLLILTLPLRFSHGPQSIVALRVQKTSRAREVSARVSTAFTPAAQIVKDDTLGCDVLEYEFNVSWRECASLSRKPMAACYVDWFHRVREAMLSPQDSRKWVAGVLDGTAGLVARSIRVRLHDEATAHDELCARIWMGELSESTATWRVDFLKKLTSGGTGLVATVEAEGRIVKASGNGTERGASQAMHDYKRFVQTRRVDSESFARSKIQDLPLGRLLTEAPTGPQSGPRLFVETICPSLIDSDLVGNISSVTFFEWMAHIRDRFLYSVVPTQMVRRNGKLSLGMGEPICVNEEMRYLREAFPFDNVIGEMSLVSVSECGAKVAYEFIRPADNGRQREKIAVGYQELVWVNRDETGAPLSNMFPSGVLEVLNPSGINREVSQRIKVG